MKKFSILLFCLVFITCSLFSFPVSALTAEERESNEAYIVSYLSTQLSLSKPVICGIVANMYFESKHDPAAVGDSGTSHGICQWRNTRWDEVVSVCEQYNKDPNTLDGQLFFLYYDLNNTRDSYYTYLLQVEADAVSKNLTPAQVAYDVGYWWCTDYEVPKNAAQSGNERGIYAAETLLPKYCDDLSDGDLIYSQTYGDGAQVNVQQALEDAFDFLTTLPDWFAWLPDPFVSHFASYFDLIVAICMVLIGLKLARGA